MQKVIIRVGAVAIVSATVAILIRVFWRRCSKNIKEENEESNNKEISQPCQQETYRENNNSQKQNNGVQLSMLHSSSAQENNLTNFAPLFETEDFDTKTEAAIGTPRENDLWNDVDKRHRNRTLVSFPQAGQILQKQFQDENSQLLDGNIGAVARELTKSCLKLCVVGGPSKGSTITFKPNKKRKYFVGRSPDCDFFIQDVEVSSRHLRFDWSSDKWFVCDTGSLNGTQINGKIISRSNRTESDSFLLQEADEVIVGRVSCIQVQFVEEEKQYSGDQIEVQTSFPSNEIQSQDQLQQNQLKVFGYISQQEGGLCVRGAGLLRQGKDHIRNGSAREDYYVQQVPLKNCLEHELGLICIFDGHGGPEAAQNSIKCFPTILGSKIHQYNAPLSTNSNLNQQLRETFLEVDRQIDEDSGCTATILVFQKRVISQEIVQTYFQVANVGDSSAIAIKFFVNQNQNISCSDNYQVLTQDHKVRSEGEKQRLDQLGVVRSHGGSRIYGLNLARTIGDRYVKEEVNLTGVIADPFISEVFTIEQQELSIIIMATDGLWDVMSYDKVKQIVQHTFLIGFRNKLVNDTLPQIAEQLADMAVDKGSRDDIGIVVVLLQA